MENHIKHLQIQNFKSLRNVEMDCERINLLIGKPNVGKSNILEAISLLGGAYLGRRKFGEGILRYEKMPNLFYDQEYRQRPVSVKSNIGNASLIFGEFSNLFEFDSGAADAKAQIDFEGNKPVWNAAIGVPQVKKYTFSESIAYSRENRFAFLEPPFGENLISVIQSNKAIIREISNGLRPYKLEMLIDSAEAKVEILKRVDEFLGIKIPFSLIADTLRRYFFHYAAIESNHDSVLLFEEPEAHTYAPYIQRLAHKIIESETNQFFITTHSPYLLNTIIEEAKDVAVFIAEFEPHGTHIHRLSSDEVRDILSYDVDIFYNLNAFATA